MKIAHIQTEIDASYLYSQLAAHEEDPIIAKVYKEMSDIEKSHAVLFAKKEKIELDKIFNPSWRAKTWNIIGKVFGYDYVLGAMMDTEKSIAAATLAGKEKKQYGHTGYRNNAR